MRLLRFCPWWVKAPDYVVLTYLLMRLLSMIDELLEPLLVYCFGVSVVPLHGTRSLMTRMTCYQ